ncbi:conjugal transfer nickase/helicase TraI [Escherichia coli]|uniref:hypothetical protein n=1 Tax=Escherichia coli TaxID=562 RepID=UPI000DFA39AF|nr:hypothetical protein [Escherichia coli]STJ03365.1 conjugal transfer nickase/helicase TraI [Escherichia coli]
MKNLISMATSDRRRRAWEVPGAVAGGHSGIHAPDLSGGASSGEIADEQVRKAVSDTISALSEKKVQFTWSEMLAGTVNRLPSAPGLFEQARAGIDAAIEGQRLIPLDREKGYSPLISTC